MKNRAGLAALRETGINAAKFGVTRSNRHSRLFGGRAPSLKVSTLETHFDSENPAASDPVNRVICRPNFRNLGSCGDLFWPPYAHNGSLMKLLGENPVLSLPRKLSNELHVSSQTPSTFLFSLRGDTDVRPENSVNFYLALRKAGVPAEIHIFEKANTAQDSPWEILH